MRYAGIIENDIASAPGINVSFFTQGCPHKCVGCQNPETWDFMGGEEFTQDTLNDIYAAIEKNDIKRNFCVMGGEPLCPENQFLTYLVVNSVKQKFPEIKVYIWTGYSFDDLKNLNGVNRISQILELTDVLIDGPFMLNLRDITLPLRGSSNQNIIEAPFDI